MTQKFDEFLEEVEQDIRNERFEKYWNKYGKIATGFVTGCLIVTGAFMLWNNNRTNQMVTASETLVSAQESLAKNKQDEGLSLLGSLASKAPGIYGILPRFSMAVEYTKDGPNKNINESINIYKGLESDKSVDRNLRDLAKLLRLSLEFEAFGEEQSKIDELRVAIEPLTKSDHPLQLLANELKAIMLYRSGAFNEAGEILIKASQDKKAPEGLRVRAQLMTQMIASKIAN